MGCDIHLYVERRENGKWITCDAWEGAGDDRGIPYKKRFYSERNYDLFAIFADVRNGRGFAGVKTGGALPRGVPDDCCTEYREASEAYGIDGHSHSWLTIAEIMAYDWTRMTTETGVVRANEWARWRLLGAPQSWAGGIAGPGILHVSPEDMERAAHDATGGDLWRLVHESDAFTPGPLRAAICKALGGRGDGEAVTQVEWTIPYYEAGSNFLGTVLPRLWRLGAPDDVRLVFFFDN